MTQKKTIENILEKKAVKSKKEFNKSLEKIMTEFSLIDNEKKLVHFFKKYSIEQEHIKETKMPIEENFGICYSSTNIKGLILLTNNQYVKKMLWEDKETEFYSDDFMERKNLFSLDTKANRQGMYCEKFGAPLSEYIAKLLESNLLGRQDYLKNVFTLIMTDYHEGLLTIKEMEPIFLALIMHDKPKDTLNFVNDFAQIYIKRSENSPFVIEKFKENIAFCMNSLSLFKNMKSITQLKDDNPKFIYHLEEANSEVFKYIVETHTLKNTISIYNDIQESKKFIQGNTQPFALLFSNMGIYYEEDKLDTLFMLSKDYNLSDIDDNYKKILDIFLTRLSIYNQSKTESFLHLLKEKYNYEYLYHFQTKERYEMKVFPVSDLAEGEKYLLKNIIDTKLHKLPKNVLSDFSMKVFDSLDKNQIVDLLKNEQTRNQIYALFLKNFGGDKRKKLHKVEAAISLVQDITSESFIKNNEITLSKKEMSDFISKRTKSEKEDAIDILFDRLAIHYSMNVIHSDYTPVKKTRL